MSSQPIIDNLRNSPAWAKNGELEQYEFFECDWCGSMCDMPINDYRKIDEDTKLKAKWMCVTCTTGERVERVESKGTKKGGQPKNAALERFTRDDFARLKSLGYSNKRIAREVLKCASCTFGRKLRELGINRKYKPKQKEGQS